jgi:hypothetical protein
MQEILKPTSHLLKINATAGSAKSSTLVEGTKRAYALDNTQRFQYIVFGNLAAKEARAEFGVTAIVSTIHSLAYQATVGPYKLNRDIAPFISWRDIPKQIKTYGIDVATATSYVEAYCTSGYTSLASYLVNEEPDVRPREANLAQQLLDLMASGLMRCTHSFYMKLYHILVVSGTITPPAMDKLMLDEAQDSSGITLDIFHRIPAKQKIMVGDTNQSIMSFLKLENGFGRYSNEGITLSLTKSFRVDNHYAPAIQAFTRKHFDPTIDFTGMMYPPKQPIVTKAYLTRTNASLISKMIDLNKTNTPYKLANDTKVKALFKWPLALVYLKPGFKQKDPELKHLQSDADDYAKLPERMKAEQSLRSYIAEHNSHNMKIQQALNLLHSYDSEEIINASDMAESHIKSNSNLTLMTAHVSKGITRDEIELDDDLNDSIDDIIDTKPADLSIEQRAEFNLYFVACTRHRHSLINAVHLDRFMPGYYD